jgi:enoyl-CoA hydratase/carnithine racemase
VEKGGGIGISRVKEISFTGNFIDAAQAERWGLVNRVVAQGELLPVCRRLAEPPRLVCLRLESGPRSGRWRVRSSKRANPSSASASPR